MGEAGDIVLHPLPAPQSVDAVAGRLQLRGVHAIKEALEKAVDRYAGEWNNHEY